LKSRRSPSSPLNSGGQYPPCGFHMAPQFPSNSPSTGPLLGSACSSSRFPPRRRHPSPRQCGDTPRCRGTARSTSAHIPCRSALTEAAAASPHHGRRSRPSTRRGYDRRLGRLPPDEASRSSGVPASFIAMPTCTCGHPRSRHYFPMPYSPGRQAPCTAEVESHSPEWNGTRFVRRFEGWVTCGCRHFQIRR
jgi:hypothetical protein